MKKIKLIELMEGMGDKDFREFGKFVHSPYFNESRMMLRIYEILKTERKKINLSEISSDKISKRLYPSQKNTGLKYRKAISDFCQLIEDFFAHKAIANNRTEKKLILIKELRKRNISGIFEAQVNELKELLKNKGTKHPEFYLSNLKLSVQEIANTLSKNQSGRLHDSLSKMNTALEGFYFFRKLFLYHNLFKPQEPITELPFEIDDYTKIMQVIERRKKHYETSEPKIYALYLIMNLYLQDDLDGNFRKCANYLNRHVDYFDEDFITHSYMLIFRHTISKINSGGADYLEMAYKILEVLFSRKIFDKTREIDSMPFFGAVNLCCYKNKADNAEKFIQNYNGKLNPYSRKETLLVSMGIVKYHQRKYDEALNYLRNYTTKNPAYYLFSRTTLIKIYFEQRRYNFLVPMLDAFKKYISRKTSIQEAHRKSIDKFVYYISKLMKTEKDREELKKLGVKINEDRFYNKKWVINQLRMRND